MSLVKYKKEESIEAIIIFFTPFVHKLNFLHKFSKH
jgi:hypothetical protein